MLIYLFEQVPGGSLLSVMEFGFLGMDSLTSQNQFLLGLGINSDNQDSLMMTHSFPAVVLSRSNLKFHHIKIKSRCVQKQQGEAFQSGITYTNIHIKTHTSYTKMNHPHPSPSLIVRRPH